MNEQLSLFGSGFVVDETVSRKYKTMSIPELLDYLNIHYQSEFMRNYAMEYGQIDGYFENDMDIRIIPNRNSFYLSIYNEKLVQTTEYADIGLDRMIGLIDEAYNKPPETEETNIYHYQKEICRVLDTDDIAPCYEYGILKNDGSFFNCKERDSLGIKCTDCYFCYDPDTKEECYVKHIHWARAIWKGDKNEEH